MEEKEPTPKELGLNPEEYYPSKKFCRENCSTGAYAELTAFKNQKFYRLLLEKGTEDGKAKYYQKIALKRAAVGCDTCAEAARWQFEHSIKDCFPDNPLSNSEAV